MPGHVEDRTFMNILVLGGDGYCGWATALYLSAKGHKVSIVDNFLRRQWDHELGVQTLTPIRPLAERLNAWSDRTGKNVDRLVGGVTDYDSPPSALETSQPDAVIHFAEQRSAPYSMIDRKHAVSTQVNNVVGTLNLLFTIRELRPDCHLIKLGTMGAKIRCRFRSSRRRSITCRKCMTATTFFSPVRFGICELPI